MSIASVLTSECIETPRTPGKPLEMKSPGSMRLTIEALHRGDWQAPDDEEPICSFLKVRCRTPRLLNKTSSATALTLHLRSGFRSTSIEADSIPLGWLVEVEKKPLSTVTRQNVPRTNCPLEPFRQSLSPMDSLQLKISR